MDSLAIKICNYTFISRKSTIQKKNIKIEFSPTLAAILDSLVFLAKQSGFRILFIFLKYGVSMHHFIKLRCDEHVLKMSPSIAHSYWNVGM